MQVVCKGCGKVVAVADVNMEKLVARCTGCNTLFDISDQLPESRATGSPARRRGPVPMPQSIVVREGERPLELVESRTPYRAGEPPPPAADFTIVRRWFSPKYVFMAFFCVAWDSFLVFWYSHATSGPWIVSVFPIAHVAVGIGLTYSTLAGFFNRTTIAVERGSLSIRHAPVPWMGNRTVATADLDQLFCQQKISGRTNNSGPSVSYAVLARLKDRRILKLLSGLPEADQALFIEQAIETRLGIEDVAVLGELTG